MTERHAQEMPHGTFPEPDAIDADAVGVQHEGIGVGAIMGFVAMVVVFITVSVTAVYFWVQAYTQDLQGELALHATYPERREVDADATARLTRYDVLDAAQGTFQIPIDRAIDLMVNEAYQQPADSPSPELPLRPGN